jgi:hypothetical protein
LLADVQEAMAGQSFLVSWSCLVTLFCVWWLQVQLQVTSRTVVVVALGYSPVWLTFSPVVVLDQAAALPPLLPAAVVEAAVLPAATN